jgi:hypothetical protein
MRAFERLLALAIAVLSLASGCAGHFLQLSVPTDLIAFERTDNEGMVILGVTKRTGVIVMGGESDGYGWRKNIFVDREHFWSAEDYIVFKATPTQDTEAYAVVAVRPERFTAFADEKPFTYATVMWHKSYIGHPVFVPMGFGLIVAAVVGAAQGSSIDWGPDDKGSYAYSPRENVDLPTFKSVAGEVAYVGSLRVEASQRAGAKDPPKKIAITPTSTPNDLDAVGKFVATHFPNVHVPVTYRPFQMVPRDELGDN